LVTAAADEPPPALLQQLKPGGRMVLPMGHEDAQILTVVDTVGNGSVSARGIIPVRFTRLETVI